MSLLKRIICLSAWLWPFPMQAAATAFDQYVETHAATNPTVIITFLSHLTDQGDSEALIWIGYLYLGGIGVERNIQKANNYFNKAAKLNNPKGYKALADSYMAGDGFQKDHTLARILYEKAAILGYGPAQFNVGVLYKDSDGTKTSKSKACYWLKKASDNKDLELLQENAKAIAEQIGCL